MVFRGSLFTHGFLEEAITRRDDYAEINDRVLDDFYQALCDIFARFPVDKQPTESHTESDLIWPVLRILGWTSHLREQNLSAHGRWDVPDGSAVQEQTP